jgi:hypothetical protein
MHLELLRINPEPLLSKRRALDLGIRFGFEGGTAHKVNGVYHLFTTECFDEPKTAASRLARYDSMDGATFTRAGVILDCCGDWRKPESYWNPWSPMTVWDDETDRWHLFYVHYVRKPGSDQPYNMTGRMARLEAAERGPSGIAGAWRNCGFIDLPDRPDPWEGSCKVVSFFPFRAADGTWWAFYGSNNAPEFIPPSDKPQEGSAMKFWVGLARGPSIKGPWTRQTALNPVLTDPDFIENPVVARLAPDVFVNLYDGGNTHAISYSLSRDGVSWAPEQVIPLPSAPAWLKAIRTPLCAIPEGDGVFTILFTAFDGENPEAIVPHWHDGYGHLGSATVRLVR